MTALPASARDVKFYGVVKSQFYDQTGTGAPTIQSGTPYAFSAFLELCSRSGVTAASVKPPGGSSQALSGSSDGFWIETLFSSQSALDTAYPDGAYTLVINAVSDGTKTNTLNLSATSLPAPRISNFTEAQNLNPDSDFKLTWDALAGGTTNDYIQVTIRDAQDVHRAFQTDGPGLSHPLNGTNTYVIIPKGTLQGGSNYVATVLFARGSSNTTSYAGVYGFSAYVKQTYFTIKTIDVTSFGVVKGQGFSQTSTAAPALQGFGFVAFVDQTKSTNGPGNANLNGASVAKAGGGTITLSSANDFGFEDFNYFDQASLDSVYPSGTYTFTMDTAHDGQKVVALSLTGNNYPATTPRVSDFTAAQQINAEADFTLTWDAFNGGTINDYVQVQVVDQNDNNIFETPAIGESGALDGTHTSVVIPSRTLPAGSADYSVKLLFARYSKATNYAGATGVGAYFKQTQCPVRTVDVSRYIVIKSQSFLQSSPAAPASAGYSFEASIEGEGTNLNASTFQLLPSGTVHGLSTTNDYQIMDFFTNKAGLDAAYPSGSYRLTVNAVHDGTKTITATIPADNYPPTPQISNFASAQAINPCLDFTLAWNALGLTTNDFVNLEITDIASYNTVFRTGEPFTASALNGASTHVVIPADTLQPGKIYSGYIMVTKASVDTGSYAGSYGFIGYTKDVMFTLVTTGTPFQIKIQVVGRGNNQLTLRVHGEDGKFYVIESSDSLSSPSWNPLTFQTQFGEYFDYTDFSLSGITNRFYRAVQY